MLYHGSQHYTSDSTVTPKTHDACGLGSLADQDSLISVVLRGSHTI